MPDKADMIDLHFLFLVLSSDADEGLFLAVPVVPANDRERVFADCPEAFGAITHSKPGYERTTEVD
jgi:hypothetical protein